MIKNLTASNLGSYIQQQLFLKIYSNMTIIKIKSINPLIFLFSKYMPWQQYNTNIFLTLYGKWAFYNSGPS